MSGEANKPERFIEHLEPLKASLEAYARRGLNRPEEVADALQSAVENAYRDFDLYVEGTNFRAWIFRYVNFEILARNRASRPEPLTGEPHEECSWEQVVQERTFEALLAHSDEVLDQCEDALADAIRHLPPAERATLLLRAIGEFKYREIAEILELPVGTVMSHLARSRVRLRRRLVDLGRQRGILPDDG